MKPFPLLFLPAGLLAAAPAEYTLTNITGWSDAQLASLPHFDRHVPVTPPGAAGDFTPVCSNGLGLVAGNHSAQTYGVDDGAVARGGSQTTISAWGSYHWSYWLFDGHDSHFYWGNVTHSPVRAANVLGQVAGYATVSGSGTGVNSTSAYDNHAYLYDAASGQKTDLTPTAHRADPRDLNDRGGMTGYWSDSTSGHAFRRTPDGTFTDLTFSSPSSHSISPSVLNNNGLIAGLVTVWTTPRDYIPFVSEAGSTTSALPYPDEDKAYKAAISDINDQDTIVGYFHKADTPLETLAIRWSEENGTWTAHDLNELLVDNQGFILDRALAINDAGHIIVSGHLDGGPDDTWNTHRFLLTPDTLPPPAVTLLAPTGLRADGVTLRVKLNACNQPTTASLDYGTGGNLDTTIPLPATGGTVPVLAEVPLAGLTPHSEYHYRTTATNAGGLAVTELGSFSTPWDWPSWAATHLPGTDPGGDSNSNGLPDLLDFATGNAPPPELSIVDGESRFSFRRSLVASRVSLTVQVSTDLITWDDGSTYTFGSGSSSNGITTEVTRLAEGPEAELLTVAATGGDHRYFRLKAELLPDPLAP